MKTEPDWLAELTLRLLHFHLPCPFGIFNLYSYCMTCFLRGILVSFWELLRLFKSCRWCLSWHSVSRHSHVHSHMYWTNLGHQKHNIMSLQSWMLKNDITHKKKFFTTPQKGLYIFGKTLKQTWDKGHIFLFFKPEKALIDVWEKSSHQEKVCHIAYITRAGTLWLLPYLEQIISRCYLVLFTPLSVLTAMWIHFNLEVMYLNSQRSLSSLPNTLSGTMAHAV